MHNPLYVCPQRGNIRLRPAFCKPPECKAFYRKTEIENRRDRICVEVVSVEAHDCIGQTKTNFIVPYSSLPEYA